MDDTGIRFSVGTCFFFSTSRRLGRIWGPTVLISNMYNRSFIVEPCIDKISVSSNQLMHKFIKNTLKSHKIHFTPTCFGSYKIHLQGAINRSWLEYLQVHGASPYSRHCGCIGEPVCLCALSAVWKRTALQSSSTQQTAHTNKFSYAATIPNIWTRSLNL